MRQLAVASAVLMAAIALRPRSSHQGWIVVGFALGAVVTVADNGLGYTAVAEYAGSAWSGRALGVQNTVQNVAAVATAPMLAAVIGDARYGLAFALAGVFALLAVADDARVRGRKGSQLNAQAMTRIAADEERAMAYRGRPRCVLGRGAPRR